MPTPHPHLCAVLVVFNEEGKILVSSRRYNNRLLNLPGGKIDPQDVINPRPNFDIDNSLFNCALRELREETDLHAETEDLVLLYSGICTHNPEAGSPVTPVEQEPDSISFTYLVQNWSGTPKQLPGEPPIRWVTWDDLIKNTPYPEYNIKVREAFDAMQGEDGN